MKLRRIARDHDFTTNIDYISPSLRRSMDYLHFSFTKSQLLPLNQSLEAVEERKAIDQDTIDGRLAAIPAALKSRILNVHALAAHSTCLMSLLFYDNHSWIRMRRHFQKHGRRRRCTTFTHEALISSCMGIRNILINISLTYAQND